MTDQKSQLRKVIESQDGIASAEVLRKSGINRLEMYELLAKGILQRESHGNYSMADSEPDEYKSIQVRSDKIIFSHATALYLNGLSDRVPHFLDVTVPQGYNVSKIKRDHSGVHFHYCRKEWWDIGRTKIVTPQGFTVQGYDMERCICDAIRNKDQIDLQIFTQALQEYFHHKNNNRKLIQYARQMKLEDKVRMYMEVLQ